MMNFFVITLNVSVVALYVMVKSLPSSIISQCIVYLGVAHCLDNSDEHPSHCHFDFNVNPSRPILPKPSLYSRAIFVLVSLLLILILLTIVLVYFLSRQSISFPIPLFNSPQKNNYSAIIQTRTFDNSHSRPI